MPATPAIGRQEQEDQLKSENSLGSIGSYRTISPGKSHQLNRTKQNKTIILVWWGVSMWTAGICWVNKIINFYLYELWFNVKETGDDYISDFGLEYNWLQALSQNASKMAQEVKPFREHELKWNDITS